MKAGKCRNTECCIDFHHPKLCHSVSKGVMCTRDKCNKIHLWTKEKTLPQTQSLLPTQQVQPIAVPQTLSPKQQIQQLINETRKY